MGKIWVRTQDFETPLKSHRINGPRVFVRAHYPKVVSSNLTPATKLSLVPQIPPFQYRTKTLCNCGFEAYFEREADSPEIVENIENLEQRMESLEGANALAKQVLSQAKLPAHHVQLSPCKVFTTIS